MKRFFRAPIYRPLDPVMVRAPLLPVDAYRRIEWDSLEKNVDARVRAALASTNAALPARLVSSAEADDTRLTLTRYLARASTRPTPFGLFAGVALGRFSDHTGLTLGASPVGHARPDTEYVLRRTAFELEKRPEVRRRLCLFANPAALVHAGRVWILERASRGSAGSDGEPRVSLKATRAVTTILEMAQRPVEWHTLADRLAAANPGIARDRIEALLDELVEQTVLLTDLRPPLTTESPVRALLETLDRVGSGAPAAKEAAAALRRFDDTCRAWGRAPERWDADLAEVFRSAEPLSAGRPADTPVQVDMSWPLADATISSAIGLEAARAAELLLRIATWSRGGGTLEAYRSAFEARFRGREVPVLQLLDPEVGLGPPPSWAGEGSWVQPGDWVNLTRRNQLALTIACNALRDRARVVRLDEAMLHVLETSDRDALVSPETLDLYLLVLAASREAIDAGDFRVAIGPNVGGGAAGRNLARFAGALGPEAVDALRAFAPVDRPDGGSLHAELVYYPRRLRSANVAIRPAVRALEIPLGGLPGVAFDQVIPAGDLLVGVDAGRFYLRSASRGARVRITSTHMLNFSNAPALPRLLAEISLDGITQLQPFDWGPAASFPFLPRLESGRIVLSPAQWRVDAELARGPLAARSPAEFRERLDAWRERWDVPSLVYLASGDNRLLLDLERDPFVRELHRTVAKATPSSAPLSLQEALPAPEHAWLDGPDGRRICELVVSLRRERVGATTPERPAGATPVVPRALDRLRPPGGDWVYWKVYVGRERMNEVLLGPVRELLSAQREKEQPAFFFVRYSDPEPHLRIRFACRTPKAAQRLVPQLQDLGQSLIESGISSQVAFDTYERELERYGGVEAIAIAETVFAVDSRRVLELLLRHDGDADPVHVAVASLHRLIEDLGLGRVSREWWKRWAGLRDLTGAEWRSRRKEILARLDTPEDGGRERLAACGDALTKLEQKGALTCSLSQVVESMLHMHCNRLLGLDRTLERRALGLLLRAREAKRATR